MHLMEHVAPCLSRDLEQLHCSVNLCGRDADQSAHSRVAGKAEAKDLERSPVLPEHLDLEGLILLPIVVG